MKKIYLILIFFSLAAFSQDLKTEAKKELGKLSTDFEKYKKEYDDTTSELTLIKNEITNNSDHKSDMEKLSAQFVKIKEAKVKLDSVYMVAQSYKTYYISKKVHKDSVNSYFKKDYKIESDNETPEEPEAVEEESAPSKTFLYFGDDLILSEEEKFFKEKSTNDVFNKILKTDSESYLGDFIIPKENKEIIAHEFYYKETSFLGIPMPNANTSKPEKPAKDDKNPSKNNQIRDLKEFKYKFKNIRLEICEGSLYDIKATLIDENNEEVIFENRLPISLLDFSEVGHKNFLYYNDLDLKKDNNYNPKNFVRRRIKLTEVLKYHSNPGNNYVPDDVTYQLPAGVEDEKIHKDFPIKYKIKQNTSLQNCFELRTYTDFLGLFSDSPNGIVQVEGKADFYIAPYNWRNSYAYFFKKISPFVNYSRLDEDKRDLELVEIPDSDEKTMKKSLDIIQKSYLKMGLKVNVYSFKFQKHFPFSFNIYFPVTYQISDVINKDSLRVNFKSLGLGGGLQLEFKRFNNFGFNFSLDYSKYDFENFNTIEGIKPPDSFWVWKNEAEVYYFPNNSKQQAIFLRLNTYNNSIKSNNEAFYQFQFGYRFSIGISKLKS
jgi:hypothetical protein